MSRSWVNADYRNQLRSVQNSHIFLRAVQSQRTRIGHTDDQLAQLNTANVALQDRDSSFEVASPLQARHAAAGTGSGDLPLLYP